MSVTTRGGDDGSTGLRGGGRIAKGAPRIALVGDLDELGAVVGVARASWRSGSAPEVWPAGLPTPDEVLASLLDDLHAAGAIAATPPSAKPSGSIDVPACDEVERWSRLVESALPPLREFIRPGAGSLVGAHLNHARTVARRAERSAWTVASGTEGLVGGPALPRWLNRLSDLLWLLGRAAG